MENELEALSKQAQLTQEEILYYNSEKVSIDTHKKSIEEVESEILKIESLKDKFFTNSDLQFELVSLSEITQKTILSKFTTLQEEYKQKWINELNLIVHSLIVLKEGKEKEISEKEKNIAFQKGVVAFQNNIQHKEIEDKLKTQKDKLADIKKISEEANQQNKQIGSYILKVREEQELFYSKIIEIKDNLAVDKENLKIEASSSFDLNMYKNKLNYGINQQSFQGQDIVSFNSYDYNEFKQHINSLFDKLFLNSVTLKSGHTNISFITELFSTNYFNISYNIIYDNDNFSNMSEGKQAFVILKLLLEFSTKTCPILIDQPEDDLDNRAIYNELATYLKKKKKDRQIIVVTHNPNIAVGADSESIIIANQNGIKTKNVDNKKFQYKTGSLENTCQKDTKFESVLGSQGIKEHVCEILEGGNEAFKQRERKYAIILKSTKA